MLNVSALTIMYIFEVDINRVRSSVYTQGLIFHPSPSPISDVSLPHAIKTRAQLRNEESLYGMQLVISVPTTTHCL